MQLKIEKKKRQKNRNQTTLGSFARPVHPFGNKGVFALHKLLSVQKLFWRNYNLQFMRIPSFVVMSQILKTAQE